MSFIGDYKVTTVRKLKDDDSGFEWVSVSEIDVNSNLYGSLANMFNTTITIKEDGQMIYHMPIPEGVSKEEIKAAEEKGMIVNGEVVVDKKVVKIEDGNIYMQDASKILTGEEWVKINTENEGELDFVLIKYKKI